MGILAARQSLLLISCRRVRLVTKITVNVPDYRAVTGHGNVALELFIQYFQ